MNYSFKNVLDINSYWPELRWCDDFEFHQKLNSVRWIHFVEECLYFTVN